jgi:hypothetical protein
MKKKIFLCAAWLAIESLPALAQVQTSVAAPQGAHAAPMSTVHSTSGRPDQYYELLGKRQYFAGKYAQAMESFKTAALYADKVSQISVGLMYLHGQGVKADPATAYAWLAVAAERNDPRYVATRDQVWAQLDAQQRESAKRLADRLSREYGDVSAEPRLAMAFESANTQRSYVPPCETCQPTWYGPTSPNKPYLGNR